MWKETLGQTVSEWMWQNSLWEKVRFLKNLFMAKIALLHVVVAVAEHEDFVIHCCFRPLFDQNGRERVPFLPLFFFISRAHLGDIQGRVGVALWEWMGKASFESSPAVGEVSQVRG